MLQRWYLSNRSQISFRDASRESNAKLFEQDYAQSLTSWCTTLWQPTKHVVFWSSWSVVKYLQVVWYTDPQTNQFLIHYKVMFKPLTAIQVCSFLVKIKCSQDFFQEVRCITNKTNQCLVLDKVMYNSLTGRQICKLHIQLKCNSWAHSLRYVTISYPSQFLTISFFLEPNRVEVEATQNERNIEMKMEKSRLNTPSRSRWKSECKCALFLSLTLFKPENLREKKQDKREVAYAGCVSALNK